MKTTYFKNSNVFSPREIEDFIPLFKKKEVNKSDFSIKEGEKCTEVAFVNAGIFRSFYGTKQGEDITYCFRFPNDLMAAYSSFITGAIQLTFKKSTSVHQKYTIAIFSILFGITQRHLSRIRKEISY